MLHSAVMDDSTLSSLDPKSVAQSWLSKFAAGFSSGDVDGTVALFGKDGWYKDILTLSFDTRVLNGHENIKNFLSKTLPNAQVSNFELDTRQHLEPELFEAGPGAHGVFGAFTFETPKALGRGNFRLLPEGESKEWKAMTAMTMVWDWKGHEEKTFELGHYENHTQPWEKVAKKEREEIERDPQVVIGVLYAFARE